MEKAIKEEALKDKADVYSLKALFVVASIAMLLAGAEFMLNIPVRLLGDVSDQIGIIKLEESVKRGGGHFAIVDGKKTIMRPCEPQTWYERDKCIDENGHFKKNGFYRDDYADTILNSTHR